MNQSNKALREAMTDLIWKAISPKAKVIGEDGAKSELLEKVIKHWQHKELDPIAQQAIALVTNHIKGRMPEKIRFSKENPPPKYLDEGHDRIRFEEGYNAAISEVQSILEEVSNADQ